MWVICQDLGVEGLSEPFIIFEDEPEALRAKVMLSKMGYGRYKLIEPTRWEELDLE